MSRRLIGSAWAKFIEMLFMCGALYLLGIVLLTIWDVLGRSAGFPAPHALSAFVELGLPAVTMLAAPWLVRQRGHVTMDLIDQMVSPRFRSWLIVAADVVAAIVSVVVASYAFLGGYDVWIRREILVLAVDVPRWYLYAIIAAGFLFCAVEFLRHVVQAVMPGFASAREEPAR